MHKLILALLVLSPLSAFANGSCEYRAYINCYSAKPGVPGTRGWARLECMMSGTLLAPGSYTTADFADCEVVTKNLGQYVALKYTDLKTGQKTTGEVYQDFSLKTR
jgi:hypothetical protein